MSIQSPSAYWGISEDEAAALPLGLRYSNNPFNIKYYNGAEANQSKWPGLIGPSVAKDQGDPQMQFATPEDGAVAGAGLLRRKYDSGMTTANSIVAGKNGWTPGYTAAAENVGREAGAGLNGDLKLDAPEGMRRMLPALAAQEHGPKGVRLMTPEFWDKTTEMATGAQFASGALPNLNLLDLKTGANAHRWGAPVQQPGRGAPMADYQWNEPNPWEMAGTGGQTAPEDDAWRRRMPAPMAGGMQPPAPTPMASPQARPDQPRQPSLMEQIVGRTQNPLFQQGLGLFLAASQGKDLNEGLNAGSTRAAAMQDVMMKNLALQKQTEQAAKIKEMMNNPAIMGQVPPALIEIARATGDPSPIIQHLTKAGGTDDTKEFEYAKKAGFEGSFTDWMKSKKNMQGEYAKQLVYGTNDAGDVVPMQAGSRGDLVQSKLPGGVKLQRDPIKVDLGDRWGFMDPTTRTIVNMVPKNLAEAESQKQQGEARGKAKASLPMVESAANNIITKVESVLNDPQLDKMVGYSGYIPNMSPEARGFMAKVKQLEGTAFLQAFESLKGAGAITETEGAQAKAALIRFQEMVQTGADYRAALRDYIDQVRRITDVARQRASGDKSPAAMPQSAQPAPDNRKRYKYNPQTGELE